MCEKIFQGSKRAPEEAREQIRGKAVSEKGSHHRFQNSQVPFAPISTEALRVDLREHAANHEFSLFNGDGLSSTSLVYPNPQRSSHHDTSAPIIDQRDIVNAMLKSPDFAHYRGEPQPDFLAVKSSRNSMPKQI